MRSPQAFWRHWHISLSTWLRDYLYIPLGGNRGGEARTRRNLLVTMLLGGLWHGAAWTFVLWGLYQGLLLVAYRGWSETGIARRVLLGPAPLARVLGWVVMFHLTCYGWLIFRATSVAQIASMSAALAARFNPSAVDVTGLLLPLLLHVTPLLLGHACEALADDVLVVRRMPTAVRYSVYAATIYLIVLFGNFGGADFIYFQF